MVKSTNCVFPFWSNNKKYTKCTATSMERKDYDLDGVPWCATEVDGNDRLREGQWGVCGSTCLDWPSPKSVWPYDKFPRPYGENGEKLKNCQPGNQRASEFENEYKYILDSGKFPKEFLEGELEWAFDVGLGIAIGEMYRGMVSNTTTGRTCMNWGAYSPRHESLALTEEEKDKYGIGAHNYCRNPEPDYKRKVWCYTADQKWEGEWEYCDVPKCPDPEEGYGPPMSSGFNWEALLGPLDF